MQHEARRISRVSGKNRGLRGIWRLDFAFGRAYFFGVSAMAHTPTNEQVEMARRHVLRGECLVAQQQLLILPAKNRGLFDLAMQGASILDTLKTSLTLARADLSAYEKTTNQRFLDKVARQHQSDLA